MSKPKLVSKVKTPPFRAVHCHMTRGATKWCYGLCKPKQGMGMCGRPAYWAYRGRTQRAIANHLRAQAEKEGGEEATPAV